MTGLAFWIVGALCAGLAVLGIAGILREDRRRRTHGKRKQGTPPGQGDQLLHAGERIAFIGAGNEDASRVWRVTRDPQDYAKGFVPGRNRKDDRT
ncbi:hypothetical protein [Anianabacter salinae]|uniref:hypothetical protein n=1 Tax=Anianabacter salinae TaxID=2851023 RepID=UPI00225E5F27|nr:hypothetical protein [Anianabacter salinae]MBV0911538.1 hypothetical protein [Anianabacter salinae]